MIFGPFLGLIITGGIIFAIVSGVRSVTGSGANGHPDARPFDFSEAAKSFGIHLGLYLAMIAVSVGVIDFLQVLVSSDQIAGTSNDMARGLSLFIIGVPVAMLLLRAIDGRYQRRAADGDTRPHQGWTVYLVAALTTTLIATLITVVQVTDDATDSFHTVDAEEVVQFFVWLPMWALHWFVLRTRFRVNGDLHLALGSVIGLFWMVSGATTAMYRILEKSYSQLFDDQLSSNESLTFWAVIGIVGAAVWAWHWLLHFNTVTTVEGDRRRSVLWYFTVVLVGILPALLTMLWAIGGSIAAVLIWFLGTPGESAVDFFDATPAVLTMLGIGFVVWAYHRWELGRDGAPVRNEPLRMHDYVVLAVSLLTVASGIALVIGLLIQQLTISDGLAESGGLANQLIVILTILGMGAAVWWFHWADAERSRTIAPFDESNSIWRKLYLIVAFGVGGLILAVCLVWLLYAFLRDLLDGDLGIDTLQDLRWQIGWTVAVVGAVWYHLDVWRVDRDTLAAHVVAPPASPPPPTGQPVGAPVVSPAPAAVPVSAGPAVMPTVMPTAPPTSDAVVPVGTPGPAALSGEAAPVLSAPAQSGFELREATANDYGEIFTLQRAAFVDEAKTYETPDVPSLNETFVQLGLRLRQSATLVAVDDGRIVGSVSLRRYREGGVDVERLMVAPDRRRNGIASILLDEVEANLAAQGESSVQLIVGEIVAAARALYDGRGYEFVSRSQDPGGPALLTVRKPLATIS